MNDTVIEQKCHQRSGWRSSEVMFPDVVKLYAKFNKSKDHKDLIHVRKLGFVISSLGQDNKNSFFNANIYPTKEDNSILDCSRPSTEEMTR